MQTEDRRAGSRLRVILARKTIVSGKISVLILVVCFALTGLLIPLAAHLPRWVEFELVLVAYWLVWLVAMSVLLYQGRLVTDDAEAPTWNQKNLDSMSSWAPDGLSGCESAGEGCASQLAVLGILILVLLSIWLLIEFIIPAVAILLYWLIRGMLSRAVNDTRDCQGHFLRSLFWGSLWATLYTAPLALIVWGVHVWLVHSA